MNWWTTRPGQRAPGLVDHLVIYVATLAMTGVAGAAVVIAANIAEAILGPPEGLGLVAALWVLGINLMHSPLTIWPLVALGAVLFQVVRQIDWGGWLPAVLIGIAITLSVAMGSAATFADALIRLAIGIIVSLIWWNIMGLWLKRGYL